MSPTTYETALNQGVCIDLAYRSKWCLTGIDRVRYLNGQVTNDVRQAKATEAMHACVTNLKGKIEGDIFIHVFEDSLILDAPSTLRESLGIRLERYIIADDVLLEDISDEWKITHFTQNLMENHSPDVTSLLDARKIINHRYGVPGVDLWTPSRLTLPIEPEVFINGEDAESFRVLQRIPAFPNELNTNNFPQEAGLEKSSMSYSKGCYIGQEILSRIKSTGKMPRVLISWEAFSGEPIAVGSGITISGKAIGTITSQTTHPVSGHRVGLGYVRQGVATLDSELLVCDEVSSIIASAKISAFINQ